MNLQTGHVMPQFHVIFDDGFTTVPYLNKEAAPPNWDNLFYYHTKHYDANDFEDLQTLEGDNIPSHLPTSEGDISSAPSTIVASQVQDLFNGDAFGDNLDPPQEQLDNLNSSEEYLVVTYPVIPPSEGDLQAEEVGIVEESDSIPLEELVLIPINTNKTFD